jgi:hypothetical protein
MLLVVVMLLVAMLASRRWSRHSCHCPLQCCYRHFLGRCGCCLERHSSQLALVPVPVPVPVLVLVLVLGQMHRLVVVVVPPVPAR